MESLNKRSSPELVGVLSRGLSILRAFAPHNPWMSNHEIAAAVDLPRPTVSRLTENLTGLGYLEYAVQRGRYRLGMSALALGYGAFASLDVWTLARPYLRELAKEADALVVLSMRDGMHMVCNEVFHGDHIVTLRLNRGSRMSLPRSAMGGALLGSLPPTEQQALVEEIHSRFAAEWDDLEPILRDAIDQVKRKGFCAAAGTADASVNGVGCVLDLPAAPHTYVVGCAGPAFRFPMERLESTVGPRLLEVKSQIERTLGAPNAAARSA